MRALTAGLRAASADADPVIAIDEEGGDVIRVAYSDGSPYPGNAALGAVDDTGLTRSVYQAIGGDLAALGINFDLAPCADVLGSADSPAAGRFGWGLGPWAPPGSVRRVSASGGSLNGAGPGAGRDATNAPAVLAAAAGARWSRWCATRTGTRTRGLWSRPC